MTVGAIWVLHVVMESARLERSVAHAMIAAIYPVGAHMTRLFLDIGHVIQITPFLVDNVLGPMLRHLFIHAKQEKH
jgi:hypothetical protein